MAKVQKYNPATKSFEIVEVAGGKSEPYGRMSIAQRQLDALEGFAKADGMDLSTPVRVTNAVKKYVGVALDEFINARVKAATPEAEDEPESE